jgi:dihydroorotate dehydrogenase electron transfer subunit
MDRAEIVRYLLSNEIIFSTVSGILTTKPSLIGLVDRTIPEIKIITTKSYQVAPNPGNREPIIVETGVGDFGNAVGLRNPGMEEGYRELEKLRLRALLNVSLSASCPEDFVRLVSRFESVADILELNFSCPHAREGYGSSIGSDAGIVAQYLTAMRKETRALLFPKLTPNVENIGQIARAAVDAGADGIVAINTVGPELYLEENSGRPLLNNPRGHVGGKSGEWIREIALQKVREIRRAVGDAVPIIGMGGITYAADARNMIQAGANAVGVGSVLARVDPEQRADYFAALKADIENDTRTADAFVSRQRLGQYRPYRIARIDEHGEDLRVYELEGGLDCRSSQFVFIWLAEISGEKPFAVAGSDPLTFIIRKRPYSPEENRGLFTHEIFGKKVGDTLFVRGPYGAPAPLTDKPRVCLVVGGTGIAVVPKLVEELGQAGKEIVVYYGVTSPEQVAFRQEIERYARYITVPDHGVIGRVLQVMQADLRDQPSDDLCFYNAGPLPMMKAAAEIERKLGAREIYLSQETNTMCGYGICGECECGGLLPCKQGTFFGYDFASEHI